MRRRKSIPKQQRPVRYAFQRELQGDLIFDFEKDHYRSSRHQLRNTKIVLRHHENEFSKAESSRPEPQTSKTSKSNLSRSQSFSQTKSFEGDCSRTSSFVAPILQVKQDDSFETFSDYANDESVTLHETPFRARPTLLVNSTCLRARSDSHPDTEFDSRKRQSFRCTVSVMLLDEHIDRLRVLGKQSRECDLVMNQFNKNVKVDLKQPFRFSCAVSRGRRYHLEIRMSPPQDEEFDWPPIAVRSSPVNTPLSLIKDHDLDTFSNGFVATYTGILLSQRAEDHIKVMYASHGTAFKTRHELDLSIDCLASSPSSALQGRQSLSNTKKSRLAGSKKNHIKKNIKAIGRTAEADRVVTSYTLSTDEKRIGAELRKVEFEGFHCPFCLRGHSDFESITSLRFHLITTHATHNFVLQESKFRERTKQTTTYNFQVSAIISGKPDKYTFWRPMTWVAPLDPFNVAAYVEGDESWLGTKSIPGLKEPVTTVENPVTALRRKKNGFIPPEQVQEIPIRQRKKYPVVPTRTRDKLHLFTSVTHRPLQPDEHLSESDDDVDETWLRDKHAQQIMDMTNLLLGKREFRIRWNDHVKSEGSPHMCYLSDVFVRWTRKDREWLREKRERQNLYFRFATALRYRGKLSAEVERGCREIIYKTTRAEEEEGNVTMTEVNGV